MTTTLQISIHLSTFNSLCDDLSKKRRSSFALKFLQPNNFNPLLRRKLAFYENNKGFKLRAIEEMRRSFFGGKREKDQILIGIERMNKERVVAVKSNQGLGFKGGGTGGGGGSDDNNNNARVLGYIALAIGCTYLSSTGQLGWILDTIVSIGLIAVILPFVAVGAFLWWAGRDIVQGNCPNCGKEFQTFKSLLSDGPQLCPYCTQPFSVENGEFVKEPSTFSSKQSTTFGQAFNGFSAGPKKGSCSRSSSSSTREGRGARGSGPSTRGHHGGRGGRSGGRGLNSKYCTHCHRINHSVDHCYELNGYPEDKGYHAIDEESSPASDSIVELRVEMRKDMDMLIKRFSSTPTATATLAESDTFGLLASSPDSWIIDSGASNHMTCNSSILYNLTPLSHTSSVQVAKWGALIHFGCRLSSSS